MRLSLILSIEIEIFQGYFVTNKETLLLEMKKLRSISLMVCFRISDEVKLDKFFLKKILKAFFYPLFVPVFFLNSFTFLNIYLK